MRSWNVDRHQLLEMKEVQLQRRQIQDSCFLITVAERYILNNHIYKHDDNQKIAIRDAPTVMQNFARPRQNSCAPLPKKKTIQIILAKNVSTDPEKSTT